MSSTPRTAQWTSKKNPHHQQHKNQDLTFRGKSQASYSSKPKLHAKLTSLESYLATPSQEHSLRYSSDSQDLFKTSPSSHGLNCILQDSMETLDQSANRTLSLAQSGLYYFFFKSLLQLREYSLSWFLGMRFFQLIGVRVILPHTSLISLEGSLLLGPIDTPLRLARSKRQVLELANVHVIICYTFFSPYLTDWPKSSRFQQITL